MSSTESYFHGTPYHHGSYGWQIGPTENIIVESAAFLATVALVNFLNGWIHLPMQLHPRSHHPKIPREICWDHPACPRPRTYTAW